MTYAYGATVAVAVMATAVSLDRSIALSVSADHLVGRYDLNVCVLLPPTYRRLGKSGTKLTHARLQAESVPNFESAGMVYRTKHPGNGAVAFHDDGRVCAVGGWDGRYVTQIAPLLFWALLIHKSNLSFFLNFLCFIYPQRKMKPK